jgi:multiple sugar transport system permease protein
MCAVAVLPLLFMINTSLRKTHFVSFTPDLSGISLHNFSELFTTYGFGRAIVTSAIVVTLACAVNAVVCALAAFAFEKKPFPGSEVIFWIYIATMMIPSQMTLIPLYIIMNKLGLLNTYFSLFIPVINAFGVFLIRQFMVSIPDELISAARLDGASDFRVFLTVIVPLAKPVLAALTVFTFLTTWNDFLWPLVSISDNHMQTVTLAAANLQGNLTSQYGLIMAGAAVSFAVPMLAYFIFQRQFVEGVAVSGLKG